MTSKYYVKIKFIKITTKKGFKIYKKNKNWLEAFLKKIKKNVSKKKKKKDKNISNKKIISFILCV